MVWGKRIALALVAQVVVLTGMPMPSQAATADVVIGHVVFGGTATVGGSLSYPCTGVGTVDLSKCPIIGTTGTARVFSPTGTATDVSVPIGGNTVGFNMSTTLCVGLLALRIQVIVPLGLPTVGTTRAGPLCTLGAAGVVTGSCGLSTGTGSANVLWAGTPSVGAVIAFGFTGVGGVLVVTGRVNTWATSEVVGVVHAVPVPTVGVPPGNSCTNKTARQFTINGFMTAIGVTASP